MARSFPVLRVPSFGLSSSRGYRRSPVLFQNRILFEVDEVSRNNDGRYQVLLPITDSRTQHIAQVLGAKSGERLRVGVVDAGMTDNARLKWLHVELPDVLSRRSERRGGRSPGEKKQKEIWVREAEAAGAQGAALLVDLGTSDAILRPVTARPKVDLLLALPRPLRLQRLLPVISQMGINNLFLTNAAKVEKDYFGAHLLRDPDALRRELLDGLTQGAVDTALPRVTVHRRLKLLLEDELDKPCPRDRVLRICAHPFRTPFPKPSEPDTAVLPSLRLHELSPPSHIDPQNLRLLLAVGPEGGWDDDYELDLLAKHGFEMVNLGPRVLRSDVAVTTLLALAHDWLRGVEATEHVSSEQYSEEDPWHVPGDDEILG